MSTELQDRVEALVADIPPGRVMSYGEIAAWCGYPGAARRVGAIARQGTGDLPWQRVVRSGGYLADMGDSTWQSDALAAEGVTVRDGRVIEYERVRWAPGAAPSS